MCESLQAGGHVALSPLSVPQVEGLQSHHGRQLAAQRHTRTDQCESDPTKAPDLCEDQTHRNWACISGLLFRMRVCR